MRPAYELIGRVAYRTVRPLLWAAPGMNNDRARVLVRDGDSILLTRSWFGRQRWSLPGGGIEAGERAIDAACRELQEEIGVHVATAALAPLGVVQLPDAPWPQTLFLCSLDRNAIAVTPRKGEIIEAVWWQVDALPVALNPIVSEAVARSERAAKMR
jgi:8-oxo-dGTP diphosphatase